MIRLILAPLAKPFSNTQALRGQANISGGKARERCMCDVIIRICLKRRRGWKEKWERKPFKKEMGNPSFSDKFL